MSSRHRWPFRKSLKSSSIRKLKRMKRSFKRNFKRHLKQSDKMKRQRENC